MSKLISYINQIQQLTPEEEQKVLQAFTPLSLSKNENWHEENTTCHQIAFINTGRMRIYYLDEQGNEVTCFVMPSDNFISSFSSFLTQTPSFENIDAIEDTELLVIGRKEIEELSSEVPKIQILRRVIAENLFIMMEKRVAMLQAQNARERYEMMLKDNPEMILHVPLQYTASFLGITPQHLSRLRKKDT